MMGFPSLHALAPALLLAGVALPAVSVAAQDDEDEPQERPFYTSRWVIGDPITIPAAPAEAPAPSAEAQAADDAPIQITHGQVFMASRLLPTAGARLSADLRDEDGDIVVAQGSELFALDAGKAVIYCTTHTRGGGVGGVGGLLLGGLLGGGGSFRHTCMMDEEDDGTFESWFRVSGQIRGLPSLSGQVPRRPKPAGGVAYESIEPEAMETVYFVGIEYRGNNNLAGNEIFDLVFGTEGNTDKLTSRIAVSRRDIPYGREILGGRFTLLSSEDDVATVRIDKTFPEQPFGITRTITWQYY